VSIADQIAVIVPSILLAGYILGALLYFCTRPRRRRR
jgi:ABC-type multidrug transport system permease subunit